MTRPPANGFTLVELLVSLALLGGLAMMLSTGFGGMHRVWERDNAAAGGETVAAAQSVLRDLIEHAFPWTAFQGSHPTVDFVGESAKLGFLSVAPAAARPARLRRYDLAVATDGSLGLDVAAADRAPTPPTERRPLLTGVRTAELGYFGSAPPDNSPRWRDSWRAQPQLPLLIRLRLRFADDDARSWPELIVRPAANLDSACVVAAAGGCKGR